MSRAEEILYQRWEHLNQSSELDGDLVGLLLSLPVQCEGDDELFWLLGLGEKVAALGGHLEVHAVFDREDETLITERRRRVCVPSLETTSRRAGG